MIPDFMSASFDRAHSTGDSILSRSNQLPRRNQTQKISRALRFSSSKLPHFGKSAPFHLTRVCTQLAKARTLQKNPRRQEVLDGGAGTHIAGGAIERHGNSVRDAIVGDDNDLTKTNPQPHYDTDGKMQ